MPAGQRAMNDKIFDVRADIGAALLREGTFTTPAPGLTVFIRDITGGELRGILVHDNRNAERPLTYLAEQGVMAQTEDGARLIMINGTIQTAEESGRRLSALRFDRYVFNLDQYTQSARGDDRETSERFLTELIFPKLEGGDQTLKRNIFLAEAHNRLSAPLYCLAFALIALAATATGHMLRSGHAFRMFLAALAGAGLRMLGYGAQGAAARNPLLMTVLYILPLGGALLATMFIGGTHLPHLFHLRRAPESSA
jgi:lipopolysaccharide export system permease protein